MMYVKRIRAHGLALAVDVVLFSVEGGDLRCLLGRRPKAPFAGAWALPGAFVGEGEALEDAARRALAAACGLRDVYLEQLATFGDPGRDPRGRVVSVAYWALVDAGRHPLPAGLGAAAGWFPAARLPKPAFDHEKIVAAARERLKGKVNYTTASFTLLPEKFTLGELQRLYEALMDRRLDARNFRKKMLSLRILQDTGRASRGWGRPGRLYRLRPRGVVKLQERGILLPFE